MMYAQYNGYNRSNEGKERSENAMVILIFDPLRFLEVLVSKMKWLLADRFHTHP